MSLWLPGIGGKKKIVAILWSITFEDYLANSQVCQAGFKGNCNFIYINPNYTRSGQYLDNINYKTTIDILDTHASIMFCIKNYICFCFLLLTKEVLSLAHELSWWSLDITSLRELVDLNSTLNLLHFARGKQAFS